MEVVQTPQLRPPRVGLLASANTVTETSDRWQAGMQFRRGICGAGGTWVPCSEPLDREPPPRTGIEEYRPVGLEASDACGAIAADLDESRARARQTLDVWTSAQLEHELWTGEVGDAAGFTNLRLASPDAQEVSTAPLDYKDAIACLEQALADCNGGATGMIHATYAVATRWFIEGAVEKEGALLLTALGTIVVPGAGYNGSGPPATPEGDPVPAADGSVWAYATGIVDVRLGRIDVAPETIAQAVSTITRDNTIEVYAQRVAAAVFDPCCHLAVEIDAPVCAAVGS